ncbi:MAG TPA: OmpW family outer membrane protein [Thermoanaerobaculia bacterium]|nr:OmpW family outer membrane protein [Thermoanaerobaculia bacterium]
MRLFIIIILALPVSAADFGIRYLSTYIKDSGKIEVPSSLGFGATAEVIWSRNLSTQLAGTFVQPAAILTSSNTDLGTIDMDVVSLVMRYRARDGSRFSPFAGAGAAVVFLGDLDDRFGNDIEAELETQTSLVVEAGVRSRISPRLTLEAAAMYLPLEPEVRVRRNEGSAAIPPVITLNPIVVSIGISRRF